jgi:MoaA/NifB/PqqE/SkfB family radical SAM enzyme
LARHLDNRLSRLKRWEAGESPGPWTLVFFPTHRCNLHCRICFGQGTAADMATELPETRLVRLVDESAELGVRGWVMVGGGDPMIRGDVVMRLCQRICERGMAGTIHTNGTLFTQEHFEALIRCRWPRSVVSMDGPNAAINDAIRCDGVFERATERIRRLTALKKEVNTPLPAVCLHVTVTRLNFDKLDAMVRLARDLGCEELGVSGLLVHSSSCKAFALSDAQVAEFPSHVRRALEAAEACGIRSNLPVYLQENRVVTTRPTGGEKSTPQGRTIYGSLCYEPWLSISITADGKAGPCCACSEATADTVKDRGLGEVWLGPYLEQVRRKMVEHAPPFYCAQCPPNLLAETDSLRAQWGLARRPLRGRVGFLAAKGFRSVRRHGLRRALRRAREWYRIQQDL